MTQDVNAERTDLASDYNKLTSGVWPPEMFAIPSHGGERVQLQKTLHNHIGVSLIGAAAPDMDDSETKC